MFLFGKWKLITLKMMQLRKQYMDARVSESISVHRTLIYRTLPMLYKQMPEAENVFGPYRKFMVDLACRPDNASDYEKGVGWHYYASTNSFGFKMKKTGGYYKNGVHHIHNSARTMMEEDYTMALTFYKAGYVEKGLEHLTRAIHMLADMCCLPHATGMTYYSPKKKVHQAYEDLARAMYADAVPEQETSPDLLSYFDDRNSFEAALNTIVETQADETRLLLNDPVNAITQRLQNTEIIICALLYRFCCDLRLEPDDAHYVENGTTFFLSPDDPPYTVDIIPEGIRLLNIEEPLTFSVDGSPCQLYRIAHRHDGLYTISPASDKKGRCVSYSSQKLVNFSPNNKKIFFTLNDT